MKKQSSATQITSTFFFNKTAATEIAYLINYIIK